VGAVVGSNALIVGVDVLAGEGILYLATNDLTYSLGNVPTSSICQATTTGSATARPVAIVVILEITVVPSEPYLDVYSQTGVMFSPSDVDSVMIAA
jgi:hypothetical protein